MKKSISLILVFLFLTSCGSAFTLKKKNIGDEFLVEKKSPLVLPPDYGKLPLPDSQGSTVDQNDKVNFKEVLTKKNSKKIEQNQSSLEKSILNKIK